MRRYLFDHLAPEDRRIARRIYLAMLTVYVCAVLLLAAAVKLSAVAAERPVLAECAKSDLKILTMLGEHGEAQDVPGDAIAAAFFSMVKARQACAAGNVAEALAIYEGISVAPGRAAKR
jgi:hypothetical protein